MQTKNALYKLIDVSSGSTSSESVLEYTIPPQIAELYSKNGFFAFESALEVFPLGRSEESYSLDEWNQETTWKALYRDLQPEGICFAQDIFGIQFLLNDGIFSFDPETAEINHVAESVEEWAGKILNNYQVLTGQPLAHTWQANNGPLPNRTRLVPITPFVLGGGYDVSNLVAMDALAAMRLRASLALQIRDLPDGTKVIYEVR